MRGSKRDHFHIDHNKFDDALPFIIRHTNTMMDMIQMVVVWSTGYSLVSVFLIDVSII